MFPLIPIAMGLAEIVPSLMGMFKGKKAEEAAKKVVGIARVVTGIDDPQGAVEALKGNPDLLLQFKAKCLDAKLAGELAEYGDEADRRKDIRESGELSRNVRPGIALTFHAAIWGILLFKSVSEAKALLSIALFTWGTMSFTIGAAYVLIIAFYFLTKGMKDYFMSKHPAAGIL